MLAVRHQQIRDRVEQLRVLSNTRYNVALPTIDIHIDIRGRVAGMALRRGSKYWIRLHVDMVGDHRFTHIITEVIPHEVAHLVCLAKYGIVHGRGHPDTWKQICMDLGGSGKTYHTIPVDYISGTYYYTSTAGDVVPVSGHLHTKIQNGKRYYSPQRGVISKDSPLSYTDPRSEDMGSRKVHDGGRRGMITAPSLAGVLALGEVQTREHPLMDGDGKFIRGLSTSVAVTQHADGTATVTAGGVPITVAAPISTTKAEQVRAQLKPLKLKGADKEAAIKAVTDWAIQHLGMTRGLARTYCTENWNRITTPK